MSWAVLGPETSNYQSPPNGVVETPLDTNSSISDSEDGAISQDWVRYDSGQGAYSIKFPNGLSNLRDTSTDFFIFRSFTDNTGVTLIEDIDGYGSDGFAALTLYKISTARLWDPSEAENYTEEEFVTSGGVVGKKKTFNYPYEPPCEGVGCYLGDKVVFYDFENGDNTIRIWYSRQVFNEETARIYEITEDSPDFTDEIDAMAKTLIIN